MNEIQKQVSKIQQSAQTNPRFKQIGEVEVTQEAKEYTNRVFKSLLPHFPAWRQSCPEPDDLGRLKNAWTKAIMRHELKTGKNLNVKAGLLACEESDTDWLPSVGRFIRWCEQSNDLTYFAYRSYNLFINRQRQIDSIGKMVKSNHAFDLRKMNAKDCEKGFIAHYLRYAEDNAIELLDAFALTETVQLSQEQQKAANDRKLAAQNECLNTLHSLFGNPEPKEVVKTGKTGLVIGKIKAREYKSIAQLDAERDRQLSIAKEMMK